MRVQMVNGRRVELAGGGAQDFQPGRFYLVDDATAAEWIAAGDAVDPDAPPPPEPAPAAEEPAAGEPDPAAEEGELTDAD